MAKLSFQDITKYEDAILLARQNNISIDPNENLEVNKSTSIAWITQ